MAYILHYGEGKKFYTTSLYEKIRKKEEFRKQGIVFTEQLTGEEKRTRKSEEAQARWNTLFNRCKGEAGKTVIRDFLVVCDKVSGKLGH